MLNRNLAPESKDNIPFQRKLHAAIEYANNTCILSDNRMEDIERTDGWSVVQKYRYGVPGRYMKHSQGKFSAQEDCIPNITRLKQNPDGNTLYYEFKEWYYHVDDLSQVNNSRINIDSITSLSPLEDPRFDLKPCNQRLLGNAISALTTRYGNCGTRSELVSKYLWEHPEGIHRIEGISMNTFDHVLVIVNRSGDLQDPDTWGNAWVIDAWYKKGIVFPAKEFKERIKQIKQYAKEQIEQLKKLNLQFKDYPESDQEIRGAQWEINPDQDSYPSYSKHMRVEDYYTVSYQYPGYALEIPTSSKNKLINTEIDAKWQDHEKNKKYDMSDYIASILRSDKVSKKALINADADCDIKQTHSQTENKQSDDSFLQYLSLSTLFTKEQQQLLDKAKGYYSESSLWPVWEAHQFAALVDIYGGSFPELFKKDEALCYEYYKKLIKFCDENNKYVPDLRVQDLIDKLQLKEVVKKSQTTGYDPTLFATSKVKSESVNSNEQSKEPLRKPGEGCLVM